MRYQRLADALLADEGLKLKPYRDSLGYWTIGVGNRSVLGEEVTENTKPLKNAKAAIELFWSDVFCACLDAQRWLGVEVFNGLCDERQEVVTQMAFQLGYEKIIMFAATRQAIVDGDFERAARQMRASLWAKQTPKRVERLASIMENPSAGS